MKPEISINNNEYSDTFEDNNTLKDIMEVLIKKLSHTERLITGIEVDGKMLNAEEEKSHLKLNIRNFSAINFKVSKDTDILFEALDSCSSYIDLISSQICTLSKLYQDNKSTTLDELFFNIVESLDVFVQLVTNLHRTMRDKFKSAFACGEMIQKIEIHLLSIMKALLPTKQKNDIVMLCDLLEYELIDNLTKWKIKVIPELKRLKRAIPAV